MRKHFNQIWGIIRHQKAVNTRLFMKKNVFLLCENAIFALFLPNKLLFLDYENAILVLKC